MSNFHLAQGFKWIDDPKEFDLNEYSSNSSKGCVLEFNLEYSKKLCQLHNDYPLFSEKIEIREKILPKYQVIIADLYNIHVDNVEKLVANFFDKEKYIFAYQNLKLYLRLGLRLKTNTPCIRIS